ncbi:MAG TPA: hypothetical protein VHV76_04325 [Mycobacteriales bacterium]|nr:hypothetical protein [Mycobacteriales bacterium]
MSPLTSLAYLPAEGVEYLSYMERVFDAVTALRSEGRIPGDEAVDGLIALWRAISAQVRVDLAAAGPRSVRPITTTIPMTPADFQQSSVLLDTLYQLLRILEMRGAIDLRRSEGVNRVILAVFNGTVT